MKFATIETRNLTVDKRYQRELDKRRVRKIVDEFDPRLLGVLEVAVRKTGKCVVFDGQHRLAALKMLGEDAVPCLTHTGLEPAEEAALFVALQRDRRNVSRLERFNARVFSGDETARDIKKIVEDCGYVIPRHSATVLNGVPAIRAVSTLERMYRKSGEGADEMADALKLAKELWEGDPKATDGPLLEGLWILCRQYGARLGETEKARLADVSPAVVLRRATGHVRGGGSWAAAAVAGELRRVAGVRGRPVVTS